jgi:hypothetical protein
MKMEPDSKTCETYPGSNVFICPECKKQYSSKAGLSQHRSRCHYGGKHCTGNNGRYNDPEYKSKLQAGRARERKKRKGELVPFDVLCEKCGAVFEVLEYSKLHPVKSKYFCNRKCANSRSSSIKWLESRKDINRFNANVSNAMIKAHAEGKFDNARKSIKFSSKNEIEIINHFKIAHAKDEWKSGGHLKLHDGVYLSRDMWSDKLKICFEYDGIWHFKNIKNQLAAKQMKDALLEKWCIDNGYRLVRIDENKYIDVAQIEDLIYNKDDMILKIGERY